MYKLLVIPFIVFSSSSLASSVYKCTVEGVVKYSHLPCGEVEEEVKAYTFENMEAVTAKAKVKQAQESSPVKSTKELMHSAKLYTIKSKIKRYQSNVTTHQKKMSKEIERLKIRSTYANNNLAGATYQTALSNEMIAVSNKYQSLIDLEENKILELTSKIEKLNN